jgi:hypothetical protein
MLLLKNAGVPDTQKCLCWFNYKRKTTGSTIDEILIDRKTGQMNMK